MDKRDGIPPLRSAVELSNEIDSGTSTCSSITETYLDRINRNEKLHAFISVHAQNALVAADAADNARRADHRVGPLHGIPVAVKDIIDIEGSVTTGGSKVWTERVSPGTATLVARMKAAGMIVLGKTHTVEFAMGSFGTNQHMGTPWNPWDLDNHRAPGGSSAGSAVSVAAGLAPWAIGTDTGGSVRIPSAWCGLTGLKTTIGRVSCHGVLPLSTTLDTPGPLCRSVEDAALLFNVLQGPDEADPLTLRHRPDDPIPSLRRGVAGLVLAPLPDDELESADSAVRSAFEESVEVLSSLGAKIVSVTLPRSFDEMGRVIGKIIGTEGYSFVGDIVDDASLPVDDDVRPRIQLGRDVSAREYQLILREKEAIKREFSHALDGIDAVLTPTTATPAPLVDSIDQTGTAAGFTRPFNLLDQCALALPNGFTSGGLPTSLQIACKSYDEATALRIGWAYQRATNWHRRTPAGLD